MIRPATFEDVQPMVELGALMHRESRFSVLQYDPEKVGATIRYLIDNDQCALVAEDNGEVIGGFIGMIMPHWASQDLVASDLTLFVHPNKRGGLSAAKMVKAYREWAVSRGAKMVNLGISTGVNAELTGQLYERMGFTRIGFIYEGN